ncbi:hypothetical protein APHAL10511_002785 [Amanita phalloides]|nr:hypothetical protein APHAL10511_002785 [Amanita phalloides]
MPLRPASNLQNDRPSSAIYIGNGGISASTASTSGSNTSTTPTFTHRRTPSSSSIPPGLPDLPEPPSPVLSNGSMSSGLPSPPATNSTGSGSTGDPASIAVRRPAAYMRSNRSNSRLSYYATSVEGELDADADDVLDEDFTAKYAAPSSSSNDNVAALQRVKNLAERNKFALDKLTLMARLASPTPSPLSGTHVRSATSYSKPSISSPVTPSPQHLPSSALSARPRQRSSLPPPPMPQEQVLSGSETEREFTSSPYASSSSTTPSLSTISSSSDSSTPPSIVYNLPHAHTSTHNATNAYRTPKHNRFTSPSSVSTPYLPATSRALQTPPPHAQLLSKTRSTGAASSSGASGSGGASRTRISPASTSSVSSSSSTAAASKSKEGAPTGGSPKRRRRSGSGGNTLSVPSLQPQNADSTSGGMRTAPSSRRNTLREGGDDVVQAALAAVASSRSRNSLDTRRRTALPREFRDDERVVVEDDSPPDPVTPCRSNSATSQWHRDVLARDRERDREVESRQSIRGGSTLATRAPVGGRRVTSEALKAVGLSPKRNRKIEREEQEMEFLADADDGEGISELGERRVKMEMVPRSATSMSYRGYTSQSRTPAGTTYSDEEEVMITAPAGLRSYRNVQIAPRENDIVLLKRDKGRGTEGGRGREMMTGRSMTSMGRYSVISTPVHRAGSSSSITAPQQDRHSTTIQNGRSTPAQVMLNHTGSTTTGSSERAASRLSSLASLERSEHTRLMSESLAMFEGHMNRTLSGEGMGLSPAHVAELVRMAQGLAFSAERLNVLMRGASKHAVEMEIDAEVADDEEVCESGRGAGMYSARDMVHVWKRVNADYREGVKASDELVRGITTFLLGIGKVLKDLGSGDGASVVSGSASGSTSAHMRSVSLNNGDVIRTNRGSSPALSGGSGGRNATTARWSVDISTRSREPSIAAARTPREEALRRLTGGTPSVRTSSSVVSSERDQDARYESSLTASSVQYEPPFMTSAPSRSSILAGSRRLLTPREQREEQEQRMGRMSYSEDVVASTSQDTITPYGPSPASAPRNRDKPLPPLAIPRSLPSAASTSPYQANGMHDQDYSSSSSSERRGHSKRKASNTSISTVRGASTYPTPLQPSSGGATTAVTTHTVSNASPDLASASASSSSLLSSDSRRKIRSSITFSKPSTESVPTLAGLRLQYEERQRTSEAKALPTTPPTPMSGSETERPPKRQTWGARTGQAVTPEGYNVDDGRVSLGRAADRSAASALLPHLNSNLSLGSTRKERRAVTDLFPKS